MQGIGARLATIGPGTSDEARKVALRMAAARARLTCRGGGKMANEDTLRVPDQRRGTAPNQQAVAGSSAARLSTLSLDQVMAFVAVADTLCFTAAADRLYLSRSGLSRRVAGLERDIGCRLFDRTTRRVFLTSVGEALLPSARLLLAGAAGFTALGAAGPQRPGVAANR